jgi:hypothetical protein
VDHIAGSKTGGRLTVEANMTNLQAKKWLGGKQLLVFLPNHFFQSDSPSSSR